ncbi:MAG: hypothetical protein WBF28_02200 [Atribacterota bacterium]
MLWIPAFAGMTEGTDGLDKSSPYLTPTLILPLEGEEIFLFTSLFLTSQPDNR